MVPKDVVRSGKFIFASGPIIISLVLVLLTCVWLFVVHVSKFSKNCVIFEAWDLSWSSSERVKSSTYMYLTMEQPAERSLMRTRNDRGPNQEPWGIPPISGFQDKTAELSKRRPRDAPNIWVPWKISRVLTMPTATFPQICNGLLFRSILRMCVQNLKFVPLPLPEIIGGTEKISAVPGYAHAPFFPKFLTGFCSDGPCKCTCQI